MVDHLRYKRFYLGPQVECEAKKNAKWNADDVVAANVDIGHERLPPAANGDACNCADRNILIKFVCFGSRTSKFTPVSV